MLSESPSQSKQSCFFDIYSQLDEKHCFLTLANAIDWNEPQESFEPFYNSSDRPAKPVRLMCGLLILKQMYNFSDENV